MIHFKKIILFALFILGLKSVVSAQETDIQTEEPKKKFGYYLSVGTDYSFCVNLVKNNCLDYGMGTNLHVLNGIQFNPWLTLSLDLQFAYIHYFKNHIIYNHSDYQNPIYQGSADYLGIKLGADFRYRIKHSSKWSPILGYAMGSSVMFRICPQLEKQPNVSGGFYLSNLFGYSYYYKNNKQLLLGIRPCIDFSFEVAVSINFKFEIQL